MDPAPAKPCGKALIAVGAEDTLWETMEWRFQGPRRGEAAKGNCGTRVEVQMERRFFLQVGIVLTAAVVCVAQPADVHLNCTAVIYTTGAGVMEILDLPASVV
jgi:hypothetical protein